MRLVRTTVILLAALAAGAACAPSDPDAPGDWCEEAIVNLTSGQQRLYDYSRARHPNLDREWIATKPNPPATEASISAAEQRLGTHFDQQLRQQFAHADGWQSFAGTSSLYSTSELTTDSPVRTIMNDLMDEFGVTADELGVQSLDDLILIGANDVSDTFILTTGCPDDNCASAPVWD
ncbi:SMI1/KNR4 family protein [Aldersonia sp. NBC_00410]|uniref:SMI1/KNR4 family protein n=1 Tax=Aldersonia sp. NBC_00410 TaxID=2975954 RepID=UPI00225B0E9E|nr:SMI1/KNR4 family protein [Aldersonia sp. NBC_00410]MCX5044832.1 SMI1/KNR4 family protein [Aldersonia sp. NBC_00410]MCX5046319.1 SMI1/KNR4 family protein [Aldersonia sp. NBC_00410]